MTSSELLKQKGIVQSPFRVEILDILLSSSKPISSKELESRVKRGFDRVTLYRTLKLFVEKQLVHKIVVPDNIVAFKVKGSDPELQKEHVHFHCTHCDRIFCMPQIKFPQIKLPEHFKYESTNLIVNGICQNCNE